MQRLLTVSEIPDDEKGPIEFALSIIGDSSGAGLLEDDLEAHYHGRYEWFFDKNGNRRRTA